jgi:2'-5' RNA ligase
VPLRLFIAVELPESVRNTLAATITALQRSAPNSALRWVRPDGIHLTLKFLGATDEDRVPAINTALRIAVRDFAPFELHPAGVGSFGGRRNLRVVWVGVEGDTAAVATLAGRVESALEPLGYLREKRAFNPHLTLARVREDASPSDRESIHALLSGFTPPLFEAFRVAHVSLMQSQLQRGGAVYTALNTFALEGA